jgi:hypothetical protein
MPADPKGVRPNCEANEKGGSKAAPSLAHLEWPHAAWGLQRLRRSKPGQRTHRPVAVLPRVLQPNSCITMALAINAVNYL